MDICISVHIPVYVLMSTCLGMKKSYDTCSIFHGVQRYCTDTKQKMLQWSEAKGQGITFSCETKCKDHG